MATYETIATRSKLTSRTLERIWRTVPGIMFLAPAVIAFLLLRYYPLVRGLLMSLYRWDVSNPPGTYVGFNNFTLTLQSEIFLILLTNTFLLYGFGLLCGFWVPIVQSLLLSELRKGHYVYRFLYVLPVAVPGIASLMVWKYIWHPQAGLANAVMQGLGLPAQLWLSDPQLVKLTLRLPGLLGGGMGVIIYLAAIQNISVETIEAAIMDGANAFQRARHIVLPSIMPIVGILFVLSLTGSLLTFDDVWIMTAGGPGYASTTLVMGVYQRAFVQNQFGLGSAWAVAILILTLILTLGRLYTMREERM